MHSAILMVTWFYLGQAPSTSIIHFTSMEACLVARQSIVRDATQLQDEARVETEAQDIPQYSTLRGSVTVINQNPAPRVSAVCAPQ
jgi:hypothetical protein